jgi:mono/diheme cytochrome c family protein
MVTEMLYKTLFSSIAMLSLLSCASEEIYDPLDDYVEHDATTILDAPTVDSAGVAPKYREDVDRGEYLVELLACGSCHTNGALLGDPDLASPLSGSDIGIAFTTPLVQVNPGVVFAPNITPDIETGIGGWSEMQIVDAIRRGEGRHGGDVAVVMPWQGYTIMSSRDAYAIASYLQHIDPVSHRVPMKVPQGTKTNARFIYVGIYEKR